MLLPFFRSNRCLCSGTVFSFGKKGIFDVSTHFEKLSSQQWLRKIINRKEILLRELNLQHFFSNSHFFERFSRAIPRRFTCSFMLLYCVLIHIFSSPGHCAINFDENFFLFNHLSASQIFRIPDRRSISLLVN